MPNLATLRRRRLLSQRELAKRAGVAPSSIHSIEKGAAVPRLVVMRKIVEALELAGPTEVDEFRRVLADGAAVFEHGVLNAAEDPVLAQLWNNDEDAVYDRLLGGTAVADARA